MRALANFIVDQAGHFEAEPLVNEYGDPLYTALVGRNPDGVLQVAVPLSTAPDGAWLIATFADGEARELLAALDAYHQGGGTA